MESSADYSFTNFEQKQIILFFTEFLGKIIFQRPLSKFIIFFHIQRQGYCFLKIFQHPLLPRHYPPPPPPPHTHTQTPPLKPGRVGQSVGHLSRKSGSWVRYPVWQHTFVSPSVFSRRAVVSYWRKYVHEVLVNRLGGLSLPRKSVVRLTDRPDMALDVYRGRKTSIQQYNHP